MRAISARAHVNSIAYGIKRAYAIVITCTGTENSYIKFKDLDLASYTMVAANDRMCTVHSYSICNSAIVHVCCIHTYTRIRYMRNYKARSIILPRFGRLRLIVTILAMSTKTAQKIQKWRSSCCTWGAFKETDENGQFIVKKKLIKSLESRLYIKMAVQRVETAAARALRTTAASAVILHMNRKHTIDFLVLSAHRPT